MDETITSAFRAAAGRMTAARSMVERRAALHAVTALAAAHPELRQPAADELCAWLRTSGEADEADAGLRREALRGIAGWDGVSVDLSGATLVDADLGGCQLAAARFADTRFHGVTSFAGARFGDGAEFQRAVFHGDVTFAGARFEAEAVFGRTRFRGRADFDDAGFDGFAWFGRGEDTWWEDDPAWDTIDDITPTPWDEPNEDDPNWPIAVLIEDYQDGEEGGDGARFAGDATFRRTRFAGPAWFCKARFAGEAAFGGARFAGQVHLDQPAVDLTGATWSGGTWSGADDEGSTQWPFGWTVRSGSVVADDSVAPYTRQLADPDPDVRLAGLRILDRLGDDRPGLRQRVVGALCAYLRVPVLFDLADTSGRTAGQDALLRTRQAAQRVLTERLRPGPGHWPGVHLWLCGATLVDLDLSGCYGGYGEFTGAQFHGTTRFDGSAFDRLAFTLGGPEGRATFHGDVVFDTAPPDGVVVHGTVRRPDSDHDA
ncbi:MAG TPA: pentapeptide repeat-containing protein [Dactylosporangium sp.]|nr:pentapeptide repeat-containing protein [Dactylosporangium sp.]